MRGRDLCLCLALALALLGAVQQAECMFVIEKGGLRITFPPEAKAKYPAGFDVALANFGSPKYGGSLMGKLIYVDKDYKQDFTCSPPCKYACQDFSQSTPKLDLRLDTKENYIMLVDRGPVETGLEPCKFAEKVWNAQGAGAKGVVVVNYEDRLTTMEAPDSDDEANYKYLANITVPATFVTKSTGDAVKALLKAGQAVYVTMDWTDALPKKQQVSWEFWTNSNDQCGPVCDVQKEFIKEMVPVAKEFDEHGWTQFTPHYIVWICPTAYHSTAECLSQCIRQGRYCSPDPDGNLEEGYSGSDVVQENLRELCVYKLANASGRPWLWWDYVTRFAQQCDMQSKQYGQECAEKVAWLGWVAGPTLICIFFLISLMASRLLAEVYCVNGVEHARYHHAVRHILGKPGAIGVSIFQLTNIFLICIAYTITGSLALKVVAEMACEEQGINVAAGDCFSQTWKLTLLFGASEVILSLVPNLESAWWVSFVGVATSLTYSIIALVLSLIRSGNHLGTVGGIQGDNVNKTFGILNALGAIAFAYSFSLILLEIQDTLRQPPSTVRTMKRAVDIGVGGSFVFYLTVAVVGYLAFGNEVPGMILTAFPGPRWLIQFANVMIVLHMVTAWQIYAQSMFDTLESWAKALRLKLIGRGAGAARADVEEVTAPEKAKAQKGMAGYDLDVSAVEPHTRPKALPPIITASALPAGERLPGSPPCQAAAAANAAEHPAAPSPPFAATAAAGAATAGGAEMGAAAPAAVVNTAPRASVSPADRLSPGIHHASPGPVHVQRVSMRVPGTHDRASAGPGSPFSRESARSGMSHRLARLSQISAMYHVDTGFTNEAVPLNDEHYYLPFWQRFLVRTAYTAIITIIAVIMPFFSSIAGLVGALTFYPLAIYFPIRMWRRVYRPRGLVSVALWVVDISMLLVCAAATVAAVRGIIKSWSSYSIFGD